MPSSTATSAPSAAPEVNGTSMGPRCAPDERGRALQDGAGSGSWSLAARARSRQFSTLNSAVPKRSCGVDHLAVGAVVSVRFATSLR